MSTPVCVSGVLGWCWVRSGNPTQAQALCWGGPGGPCRVCWVHAGAGVCAGKPFTEAMDAVFFLYARTETPNKPNTPNTDDLNALIYIGFKCVGFVLGWAVLCWVGAVAQGARHD